MARKSFPAVPAKKKPVSSRCRAAGAKLPLCAHPRLVRGFLVRVVTASTTVAAGNKTAFTNAPCVSKGLRDNSELKLEGPGDDATFH